jgi:hypothetical protein
VSDEVEAMARRLCFADNLDPDELGFDARYQFPITRMGIATIPTDFSDHWLMPLWKFYAHLAEAALSAGKK